MKRRYWNIWAVVLYILMGTLSSLPGLGLAEALADTNEIVPVQANEKDNPKENPADIEKYFEKSPNEFKDEIHVTNAGVKGKGAGVYNDPVHDGALLTIVQDSDPVKVDVEGREGIGAIYWVTVIPAGAGEGDPPPDRWADVQDIKQPGALILKDTISERSESDLTETDDDTPMLHCSMKDSKGEVEFWLIVESGSYNWIIKQGDSTIANGTLSSNNDWKANRDNIDPGLYQLEVTKAGDSNFKRRIDFVINEGVILSDAATGTIITEGDYVYITKAALMPQLEAVYVSGIEGQVEWSFEIRYQRSGRNDHDLYPPTGTKTTATNTTWQIAKEMGSDVRGGEAVLHWTLGQDSGEIAFHIRGHNPDDNPVEHAIGDAPWFSRYIAKHESRQGEHIYNQFNETGAFNQGATDVKYTPNASSDGGFGLFQLTHIGAQGRSPNAQELWSWKTNMSTAKSEISRFMNYADRWMNAPVGSPGFPMGGQRVQAENETGNPVPVPDRTESDVKFSDGTSRPIEHAVAIKRYNGASGGNYCSWDNAAQSWKFNPTNNLGFNYVRRICEEVPQ